MNNISVPANSPTIAEIKERRARAHENLWVPPTPNDITDTFVANKELELARLSPAGFAMYASHGEWKIAKHLAYLNEKLLDLAQRKIRRLIISMPPRHGKSELVSKYLPAWVVGALREKVILTSYEANFAGDWGEAALNLFREHGETVFNSKVRPAIANKTHWETTDGGVMYTSGVGGPLTGKGCHWLIIDDPIKGDEDADSPTIRNNADKWFRSTAFTRLEPQGVVIIMMTRWHEDDIVGRRLKEEADSWTVVNFPALAEEHDILGREPGDALWPERFNVEDLKTIRSTQGPRWWYAMYQQNPQIEGGNKIQTSWWNYYDDPPSDFNRIAVSWDTAWGTKEHNAFSVAAVWGATKNGYYLLELRRARVEYPDLVEWAHYFSAKYPNCIHVVEDAASGTALQQTLRRETTYPVHPVRVHTDKTSRLNEVIANIEAGRCWLPKRAPWLHEFLEEHQRFPGITNKDQVDSTSLVLKYLSTMFPVIGGSARDIKIERKDSLWGIQDRRNITEKAMYDYHTKPTPTKGSPRDQYSTKYESSWLFGTK